MDTTRWKRNYYPYSLEKKSKSLSMITIMLIASFLLAYTPSFLVYASSSTNHIEIPFQFDDPVFHHIYINNTTYTEATIASCIQQGEQGAPTLPVYTAHILLPRGKTISTMKLTSHIVHDVSQQIRGTPIIPQQPACPLNETDINFTMNESSYEQEQPLYEGIYTNNGVEYCRGYPILSVHLYPLQYTPAHETLLFFKEMTLSIDFTETQENHPFLRNTEADIEFIRTLVQNPSTLSTYDTGGNDIQPLSTGECTTPLTEAYTGGLCHPNQTYTYVIITTTALKDTTGYTYNWSDLLQHRITHNELSGIIVTVEDIYRCSDYFQSNPVFNDSAALIREFCKDAYLDWQTTYILLGGSWQNSGSDYLERQIVPCRMFTDRYEYQTYDTMPCDLYYSNLDGDWYYESENIWGGGRYGTNDKFSELCIGRLPVWNAEMISKSIQKIIWYDECQDEQFLSSCGFLGGDLGWSITSKDYMEELRLGTGTWASYTGFEEWNSIHPSYLLDTSYRYYDADYGSESAAIDACKTIINNNQISILNHLDHGYMSNTLSLGTGSTLANTHFFFGASQACLSGRYTEGACGASTFLSSWDDRGAFALLLNTGYGYGYSWSTEGASQLQQKIFWNYFFANQSTNQSAWQLGNAMQYTKDVLSSVIDGYSHAYCYVWYSWHLFGDPAQTLRITVEQSNQAPTIDSIHPINNSQNISITTQALNATIQDSDNDTLTWSITTNPDIGSGNGTISSGETISCPISNLSYYTTYEWVISASDGSSWKNETYSFTTALNPLSQAPTLGQPTPGNQSGNQPLSLSWNITISDANNDTINWTITCSTQNQTTGINDTTGIKTLTLEQLTINQTYIIWVNATDGTLSTHQWFSFTTRSSYQPAAPTLFNCTAINRTTIQLTWNTTSSTDSVIIEKNTTQTWEKGCGVLVYNGSNNSILDETLQPGTQYYYQAWGWNQTDSIISTLSSTTNTTTEQNQPVSYATPTPDNQTINTSIALNWSILLTDPEGDLFNWSIHCNNGQNATGETQGNGSKTLNLTHLSFATTYTVFVNASDSYNTTRAWYAFTTIPQTDFIKPNISEITLTSSTPLDTNPAYGWENISCYASDDQNISTVTITLVFPNETTLNTSMIPYQNTTLWFYNTSLQEIGNYSYNITVVDTSWNTNTSEPAYFTLAPNWDVSADGVCDLEDMDLISTQYGETGSSGWVREDVDNNGIIQVLDLVIISNHYEEHWMG